MDSNFIINSVALIQAKNDTSMKTGTSFFAEYNHKKYLITNKHIILGRPSISLKMKCKDINTDSYISEIITSFTLGTDIYYDEEYDLCIIPINPVIHLYEKENRLIMNTFINLNDDIDIINQFDSIENVFMCGYPCTFRDEVNNYPIVLDGITSTPININYNGKEEFLTNVHGYKGSSGSPVFCKKDNLYYFIGLYYGNKPLLDADELLCEIPDKFKTLYKNVAASNIGCNINKNVIIRALNKIQN